MAWFESVAEAQRRARRVLPKSVYKAILAGAERGQTYQDNLDAFAELGFAPHVAGGGGGAVAGDDGHGRGRLAAGAALPHRRAGRAPGGRARGRPRGGRARRGDGAERLRLERDRGGRRRPTRRRSRSSTGRARGRRSRRASSGRARAGAKGLIITLDWTFTHSRDWGSPTIPSAIDFKTMVDHAPEVLLRPLWLARWLKAGHLPALEVPNVEGAPGFFAAYGEWMGTPPPSWEDLAWLRALWDGAVHAQGRSCASTTRAGPATTSARPRSRVSNHGGNNLDGTPARDPRPGRGGRGRRRSSRWCSTAASAAAATSSRRSRWAPAR